MKSVNFRVSLQWSQVHWAPAQIDGQGNLASIFGMASGLIVSTRRYSTVKQFFRIAVPSVRAVDATMRLTANEVCAQTARMRQDVESTSST